MRGEGGSLSTDTVSTRVIGGRRRRAATPGPRAPCELAARSLEASRPAGPVAQTAGPVHERRRLEVSPLRELLRRLAARLPLPDPLRPRRLRRRHALSNPIASARRKNGARAANTNLERPTPSWDAPPRDQRPGRPKARCANTGPSPFVRPRPAFSPTRRPQSKFTRFEATSDCLGGRLRTRSGTGEHCPRGTSSSHPSVRASRGRRAREPWRAAPPRRRAWRWWSTARSA
jgi:hypothetical protein